MKRLDANEWFVLWFVIVAIVMLSILSTSDHGLNADEVEQSEPAQKETWEQMVERASDFPGVRIRQMVNGNWSIRLVDMPAELVAIKPDEDLLFRMVPRNVVLFRPGKQFFFRLSSDVGSRFPLIHLEKAEEVEPRVDKVSMVPGRESCWLLWKTEDVEEVGESASQRVPPPTPTKPTE